MISAFVPAHFELRKFLGRGALGDVYLAWDRERSEEVALKLVRTAAVPSDMLGAEKYGTLLQQRLAEVAPQVPRVFASGEENGTYWISMEYVDGIDLAEAMAEGPFPEPRAIRIAIELCSFLHELHGFHTEIEGRTIRGIVHGDLKPQNLRLQEEDHIRVLDFGIARSLSVSRAFTNQPFGSLPYISPERLDTGEVNRSSDLWSVGVLLYAMAAGYLPFDRVAPADLENDLRRGTRRPLPSPCSPSLRAILDRCLQPELQLRYLSAAALKADLEAALEGRHEFAMAQETRRTLQPRERALPASAAPSSGPGRSGAAGGLPILLGLLATFGACQGYVGIEARHLQRDLASSSSSEAGALWKRYQGLHRLDLFGLVPDDLQGDMKDVLLRAAGPVLSRAPEAAPPTTKEEWEAAREHLAAALTIDGTDLQVRSRLSYCRAHLALADTASLQGSGEDRRTEEALAELADAARLDDAWPQPYVARARIYSQKEPVDFARLEAELAAAEQRGYPKDRLVLYRAEGYYAEAQRLYSEALQARGNDRERDLLASAIEGFSRTIDLCDHVPGDPRAERTRASARRNRQILEARYAALDLPW